MAAFCWNLGIEVIRIFNLSAKYAYMSRNWVYDSVMSFYIVEANGIFYLDTLYVRFSTCFVLRKSTARSDVPTMSFGSYISVPLQLHLCPRKV